MQDFWNYIDHFTPKEFADDVNLADPLLFTNLNQSRKDVDERVYPSPVKGSLARLDGRPTSTHYAKGKLSTGIDVFIEGIPMRNFQILKDSRLFTGIGIYLDTNGPDGEPWVMFHLDLRPISLYWFATNQINPKKKGWKYCYPTTDCQYWRMFKNGKLYQERYHK